MTKLPFSTYAVDHVIIPHQFIGKKNVLLLIIVGHCPAYAFLHNVKTFHNLS